MITNEIARELGTLPAFHWALEPTPSQPVNVFEERLPPEPDVCVAVYSTGGSEADSKNPWDPFAIQLIIRGDDDPSTAIGLWYQIYDHLHGKRNVALPGGTILIYLLVTQAGPAKIGADESGRYSFSMNLRGEIHRGSTHRPA